MKPKLSLVSFCTILIACNTAPIKTKSESVKRLIGTWKLVSGTLIEKGDTIITDYTKNKSFIKIINETHFAFLQHDLQKGKDSSPVFASGGGRYSLADSTYTEHLEYCSDREWEGHDFTFKIDLTDSTLVQQGVEKVESAGINRINLEKYVRVN